MTEKPTEQEINAYVDGELAPQDIARVAEAIARDTATAARVATLTRMKSAMAGLAHRPGGEIVLPSSRCSIGFMALAACVALFIAVGVVVLTRTHPFGSTATAWFDEARAEHLNWAIDPANPNAEVVEANLHLANLERMALPVQSPDLTSARLRLTYEQFYAATRTAPPALHLGYTGRRGCKITLWVTSAPESLNVRLTEIREAKTRGYRWRVGQVAYAMFATGMEEHRFTVIARKVYESTRKNRGFDDGTRMALNKASAGVPPCQA